MNDLRVALRQLRYAPAFTMTALATIAICLGANLAIFAVIDAILLRSLPFPQSDRLVAPLFDRDAQMRSPTFAKPDHAPDQLPVHTARDDTQSP